MFSLLKGVAMYYVIAVVLTVLYALGSDAFGAEPQSWMLMEAPDHTDMAVENRAYQIDGGFPTRMDCREALTTYSSDAHRWCAPLNPIDIQPLDRTALMEVYNAQ